MHPASCEVTHLGGLLDQTSEFEGTLRFGESLRIDGRFRGTIESEGVLIVGERAVVEATIRVGSISVAGLVQGSIQARERVEVFNGGRLECDVITPSIRIEEGATFHGACETLPAAPRPREDRTLDMSKVGHQLGT